MSSLFERVVPIAIRGRIFGWLTPLVSLLKKQEEASSPAQVEGDQRPSDEKHLAARALLDMQPISGERPKLNLVAGDDTNAQTHKAIILYFHSGGFCLRVPPEEFLMQVSQALGPGVLVYSGEYRLAPEHRFPVSHGDADKLLAEVMALHPHVPIVVGGASAGGNLAGYAASHAFAAAAGPTEKATTTHRIKGVYMNCPIVASDRDTVSRQEFATGRFLTLEMMNDFQDSYGDIPNLNDMTAPTCPVLVHSAVEDILFTEGQDLAWPTCRKRLFPSALHDFVHSSRSLCGASAAEALEDLVTFVKEVIPLE
jgi:acetyl esterase/lipase